MTTIAFHKDMLYADKLGTVNLPMHLQTHSPVCAKCNSDFFVIKEVKKIIHFTLADNAKYVDERVVAFACAGNSWVADVFRKLFKENINPLTYWQLLQLNEVSFSGISLDVLLVTKKEGVEGIQLRHFSFDSSSPYATLNCMLLDERKDHFFGSGASHAAFARSELGLDMVEAMQYASVRDKHTSSEILIFSVADETSQEHVPEIDRKTLLAKYYPSHVKV